MIEELPLVSILIPTYNRPAYFEQALQSAIAQTYANKEIIIADDSTNDETERLIRPYLASYPFIRYIKNPRNMGQFENDLQLLELAQGDYINFLMDDDAFHTQKLERMVPYLMADKMIKLVTSHRQGIDANSNLLPLRDVTMKVIPQDSIFDGQNMVKMVFVNQQNLTNFNFIGEPTTVLFRKSDLVEPFGYFAGRRYGANVDLATWFSLMTQGKGVYLADTLSYFRIHEGRQMNSFEMNLRNVTDHAHSLSVIRDYFEMEEEDYETALLRFFQQLYAYVIFNKDFKNSLQEGDLNDVYGELQIYSLKLFEHQREQIEFNFSKLLQTYR